MPDYSIILPSKPRAVLEKESKGVFEIDGLYPGYGHTLGNSLRRIILSSLPGAAITSIKISGVEHEFSVINGIKEDVINIMLNLKGLHMSMKTNEPQTMTLKAKGSGEVTADKIEIPGQIEIINKDLVIATLTDKNSAIDIEMTVEKGLGYVSREMLQKGKVDIGTIVLDTTFTPIKRVSYEVENMRVGDRTDFNRLRIFIETDGTLTPREAIEKSIKIMIEQLKSIIDFQEDEPIVDEKTINSGDSKVTSDLHRKQTEIDQDVLKTRIESMNLSVRTMNALSSANIRTLGGLTRKKERDLLEIDGLGAKGIEEIKKSLESFDISLK